MHGTLLAGSIVLLRCGYAESHFYGETKSLGMSNKVANSPQEQMLGRPTYEMG